MSESPVAAAERTIRESIARIVELQIVERGMALAALFFTALIPLVAVYGAVAPAADAERFAGSIARRFRLDPDTAQLVSASFVPSGGAGAALSAGGALLVVISALSFTRALQRTYEGAWRLPQRGVRGTPAGALWLVCVLVAGTMFGTIRTAVAETDRPVLSVVVALALSCVLWLLSPWILLSRRVPWRRLVPTALLTAVAMTALSAASIVYMPDSIADSARSYGPIGVSVALVSWLVGAGFVLVGCAAVGAVLAGGGDEGLTEPDAAP